LLDEKGATSEVKALRSFQVKTVADMIDKLDWEIGMLTELQNCTKPESVKNASYFAINAAITAWAVVDWLWHVANEAQQQSWMRDTPPNQKPAQRFQRKLESLCPAMRLCKEIANASKHLSPGRFTDREVRTSGPEYVTIHATAGTLRAGEPIATHSAWLLIWASSETHTAKSVLEQANDFLWGFAYKEGLLNSPETS